MPPVLTIDLAVIESNARAVVGLCTAHGLRVTGVTKGVAGDPAVAAAMVRGGVAALGDSRLEHLERLRGAALGVPLVLLRVPALSRAGAVVELADVSLNSDLAVLAALSADAVRRGRVHDVVVMVDLGDLREGVWPDELHRFVRKAVTLDGIRVAGLGANLACFGGVAPTAENMRRFADLVDDVEQVTGHRLDVVSGGNSSALTLIAAGAMPSRIDDIRIGEAILLGRETVERRPWPGTRQDAVELHGEIIELRRKPSAPVEPQGLDALGHHPSFEDHGIVDHALVDLGAVDADVGALTPLDPAHVVMGASSDYLVLDVTAAGGSLRVGDQVGFALGYAALATASTSPYVEVHTSHGVPRPD
ncbi:MAG TPA: alanine/ornithine racemase family PLP-dependent enzyme [Acidimicrobiales bacterium]